MLAALQVLAVLRNSHQPLSILAHCFDPVPQKLRNLPVSEKINLTSPTIAKAIADAEQSLAGRGRLLVRPSGTEPILRVMVEADDETLLEKCMESVSEAVEKAVSVSGQ